MRQNLLFGALLSIALSTTASAQVADATHATVSGVPDPILFEANTPCLEAAAQLRGEYRLSTVAVTPTGLLLAGRGKKGRVAILNCGADFEPVPTPDPEPVVTPTPLPGPTPDPDNSGPF